MNFEETIADKLTRQSEHHRLLIVAKDEKIAELEKQSHKLQEQNEKLQLELQNFKTLYIEQAKTMGKLLTGFLQLEATFGEVLHDHSTRRKEHQQREGMSTHQIAYH